MAPIIITGNNLPEVRSQLLELGTDRLDEFQRRGELDAVDEGIPYMALAAALTPQNDLGLPPLLANLGTAFSLRFQRLGQLDDLENALRYKSRALALTPEGHPDFPVRLHYLGSVYSMRFQRLGELDDIEKGIEYESRALALLPDDYPELPFMLINVGMTHILRFQRLGELSDNEKAIEYLSIALASTPDDDPNLPTLLMTLGASYNVRFLRLGEPGDIEKAIEYKSRALSLTPDDHQEAPFQLINLAGSHMSRFRYLGELNDIEKAMEYSSRALTLTPNDHPGLSTILMNVGELYDDKFTRLGELGDLDKAIEYKSRALALTPNDHSHLPFNLNNLGKSYGSRSLRLGQLDDIEKAVECMSRAVALIPEDHPEFPPLLMNLGLSYYQRFNRLGKLRDLDKAIECNSRTLSLTPDGHAHLPHRLISLGVCYMNRFGRSGNLGDVEEAIKCHTRALALTPDGHPDLPARLINLARLYADRFRSLDEPEDIVKATKYASRALALTPDGHAYSPSRNHHLARIQFFHALHSNNPSLLQDSLRSYRKASQSLVGAPNDKFTAAIEWATFAHASDQPESPLDFGCIEAYQTAIDLLPQLVWLGATTSQRYQDLDRAKDLAVCAASAAITSSKYKLALEWLEHARCVVWSQNLMLRSPLDQLESSYPALAARLQTVSNQLRNASTESQASRELGSDSITPEQAGQQHRRLAEEYDDILSEARKLPGFEDFLRPTKADSFIRAARNGPIVVINCFTERCDALVIAPGQEEVIHIPLPNFTGEKATSCWSDMRISLNRKGIRQRGFKVRQEPGRADKFESVLAVLWNDVVKPVLGCLGYMNNTPSDSLPHITWCPTGALSFLPLHAAGDYDQPRSRVFDYVISSYTPTLTALLASTPSVLDRDCRVLAIGQVNTPGRSSLPGTARELEFVKAHTQDKAKYTQLMDGQATKPTVLDAMEEHDWVHLACHAHQNIEDPNKSGFFLHDGTLDLASINRRSFKNKGLAFLSACQTATGDEKLPDEAVHLASGMLMAGYTSVIATMWSVKDEDAPLIADKVYAQLMKDGKLGNGEAGKALHNAVAELRDKVGEKQFGRWVPYIHIGS